MGNCGNCFYALDYAPKKKLDPDKVGCINGVEMKKNGGVVAKSHSCGAWKQGKQR
jgi:hypothetical protein